MKNTNTQLKIGALAFMAGLYGTVAVAETLDGTAIATVIAPLVLNNPVTMDFTTIASGTNGGVLTMDAAGAVTVLSGDADVVGLGAGTTLKFDISGNPGQAYTLTVGNGVLSDGTNTMNITTDPVTDPVLALAAQTVSVSGDLAVGALQPAGAYTTAGGLPAVPITITANYD